MSSDDAGGDRPREDARTLEQERITAALIGEARAQVAAALSNADSHDTKALALLAVDLAGVALLVGSRSSLDRFWWVSLIPALVSSIGFIWTLAPREFDIGPNIEKLYENTIDGSALEANVALLDSLNEALDDIGQAADRKRVGWVVGAAVMLAAVPVCASYLAVVH